MMMGAEMIEFKERSSEPFEFDRREIKRNSANERETKRREGAYERWGVEGVKER